MTNSTPIDVEKKIHEIFQTLVSLGVAEPMKGDQKDGILFTGCKDRLGKTAQTEVMRLCTMAGMLMTGPGYLVAETSYEPHKDVIGFYCRFRRRIR